MKESPPIIVDSREQCPLVFTVSSETGTLETGDYSVIGLTHLITVERKSLANLLACAGRERDRFKRELQRLRAYRFRLLVVESDAARCIIFESEAAATFLTSIQCHTVAQNHPINPLPLPGSNIR